MNDLLQDIAEAVDELTNPIHHIERIQDRDRHRNLRVRRVWKMTLPSLLDQLAAAVIPGEAYTEDDVTRRGFTSRPAARLDAIDRLVAIEAGAARWCTSLGLALRDTTTGNIRALVGAASTIDSDTATALLGELRSWRTWAATVTGWDRPPDAPRAPCPLCDARGSLRVRLDRKTGCCLSCGAAWDPDHIGLLAEHVTRHIARSERAARAASLAERLRPMAGEHVITTRIREVARPTLLILGPPEWSVAFIATDWQTLPVGELVTVELSDLPGYPLHLFGRAIVAQVQPHPDGHEAAVKLLGTGALVRRADELDPAA